jgi:hypothetical protein
MREWYTTSKKDPKQNGRTKKGTIPQTRAVGSKIPTGASSATSGSSYRAWKEVYVTIWFDRRCETTRQESGEEGLDYCILRSATSYLTLGQAGNGRKSN